MAKTGRKPKPDNIREIGGYAGHRAKRNDLKPEPIMPEMPSWLTPKAKEVWSELAPELGKNALLTKRDKYSFGMLCSSAALYIYASEALQENGSDYVITVIDESHQDRTSRHPAIFVMAQAFKDYAKMATLFGLDPTSRVGLGAHGAGNSKGSTDNGAEDLFA